VIGDLREQDFLLVRRRRQIHTNEVPAHRRHSIAVAWSAYSGPPASRRTAPIGTARRAARRRHPGRVGVAIQPVVG
jgi:hypothetical protein